LIAIFSTWRKQRGENRGLRDREANLQLS